MKIQRRLLWTTFAMLMAIALSVQPSRSENFHSLSAGARYHKENTPFSDLPYGDADIGYTLAYTFTEGHFGMQLGAEFAPHVTGSRDAPRTNSTDFVITPQINLIVQDRIFRGGVGLLTSYMRDDQGENSWMSPYWQMMLGLCIPLFKGLSLEGDVYYVMEGWDRIVDFRFDDLEYGLWLNYTF